VDLTQPPVPDSTQSPNPYPCPALNVVLPLNTSQKVQFSDTYKSLSVYVGGQPAQWLDGGTALSIPASSEAGPADAVCIDDYGNTSVVPNGVSYGVDPIAFGASLLPPSGNPGSYLFGFGFSPTQVTPSVTIDGQQAVNVAPLGDVGFGVS
jgi:hypothetical protein